MNPKTIRIWLGGKWKQAILSRIGEKYFYFILVEPNGIYLRKLRLKYQRDFESAESSLINALDYIEDNIDSTDKEVLKELKKIQNFIGT